MTDKLNPLQWLAIAIMLVGISILPDHQTLAAVLLIVAVLIVLFDGRF